MTIKVKMNTNQVLSQLQKSILKYRGGTVKSKIYNTMYYAPFVERGWGGGMLPGSSGKESFNVNFSPRFMVRNSLDQTKGFFERTLEDMLATPRKEVVNELTGVLELTTEFGMDMVLARTPVQSGDLIGAWQRTAVEAETK